MAAYKNLGDELQCPICKELFKVPKVMGTCLHVACLECLEQLVAARGSTDFFPCPVCRKKCIISTQGVAAMKDDFRLRAIVEKYQNWGKDKDVTNCIVCSNPASHFCMACENSYLCKTCSGQHSKDPLTTAHELIGICRKHGKSLTLYCRKCSTAICKACLISDHPSSSQEHDVAPHQEVICGEVAALALAVENLEATQGQKENVLSNSIRIQDSLVATVDSDLSLLGKRSDTVIEKADKTRSGLIAELGSVQEQIDVLMKRKEEINEAIVGTDNKITSVRQKKIDISDGLKTYRDACVKRFEDVVKQAVAETEEIKAKVDKGREETSSKRVVDDQTVPSLQKVKEELVQTLAIAEEIDRVAPFVDATERLPRFVPASTQMEVGHIRREFTKLKKSDYISFPADCPCRLVSYVGHLPNGHLACLYLSNIDEDRIWADTIRLHDLASPAVSPVLMDKHIHPAVAMTVTSKGELVVLREEKPAIKIFGNVHKRDIDIGLASHGCLQPYSVECDEEDNMFIAACSLVGISASICVFNSSGAIITQVNVENFALELPGMSYCRLTRTLYIADGNTLLRYHWDGTTLKEMPSIVLGVDRFTCTDVCIGDGGEVFVAGTIRGDFEDDMYTCDMDEYTSMIYQVVEADENESQEEGQQPVRQKEHATARTEDEETSGKNIDSSQDENKRTKLNLIELRFDDKVERWTKGSAYISIFGNTLALGYDDKLELFDLLP